MFPDRTRRVNDFHEPPSTRVAFLCDAMLGSLARWLRFFGFDTLYFEPGVADGVLARAARLEGRWLVTRDRRLAAEGPRTLLLRADSLDSQLVEVFSRLGLHPAANLDRSRCGECNGALKEVRRSEVSEVVPPHVLATAPRFRRCSDCGRVFWPGTHSERIIHRMVEISESINS